MIIIDIEFNYCSNHELIDILVSAIEAKDSYTNGHSNRVADIASWICEELDITKKAITDIHIAAHLHDIGKIKVPDYILNKPDKLLPEEWEQIKQHPTVGYNMLSNVESLKYIATIVLHHHERWDGQGYPKGLYGSSIPFGSRVITLADSIDAMLSDRPYRKAMKWSKCRQQLINGIGVQYDPHLLETALSVCEKRRVWEYMEVNK